MIAPTWMDPRVQTDNPWPAGIHLNHKQGKTWSVQVDLAGREQIPSAFGWLALLSTAKRLKGGLDYRWNAEDLTEIAFFWFKSKEAGAAFASFVCYFLDRGEHMMPKYFDGPAFVAGQMQKDWLRSNSEQLESAVLMTEVQG